MPKSAMCASSSPVAADQVAKAETGLIAQCGIRSRAAARRRMRSESERTEHAAAMVRHELLRTTGAVYFRRLNPDYVIAPGWANVDLALGKGIPHASSARLELRWEIFNFFNRTNFDMPNRTFGTPNFGRIFGAGPARQMQRGLS